VALSGPAAGAKRETRAVGAAVPPSGQVAFRGHQNRFDPTPDIDGGGPCRDPDPFQGLTLGDTIRADEPEGRIWRGHQERAQDKRGESPQRKPRKGPQNHQDQAPHCARGHPN
jgi:hypothetical protein